MSLSAELKSCIAEEESSKVVRLTMALRLPWRIECAFLYPATCRISVRGLSTSSTFQGKPKGRTMQQVMQKPDKEELARMTTTSAIDKYPQDLGLLPSMSPQESPREVWAMVDSRSDLRYAHGRQTPLSLTEAQGKSTCRMA